MISGWRTERRIGPPRATEALGDILRAPGLVALVSAGGAIFIVLVKMMFGDLPSVSSRVAAWCVAFAVIGGSVALQWFLNRRWADAAITLGLIAVIAFVVWRFGASTYFSVVCMQVACVVPVTP